MGFRYIEGKSTITFYELKKTENGKYYSIDSKNTNNLNKYILRQNLKDVIQWEKILN
jgi:hypothetical protein